MPENVLWMHDSAARDLGVSDGESVVVSSNGYSATIKARVSPYMHPEAVFMVHGFGRSIPAESRACGKGVSDISLMSGGLGPVGSGRRRTGVSGAFRVGEKEAARLMASCRSADGL